MQRIETQFAGRPLMIETGRLAKQAAGSRAVAFGDTMVLAAVTVSPNISTLPFFPLTVEYREKTYAAGKIPGGFLKREGRPSDNEILAGRLIDRSIRPLFPEGFKNEVQVFVTVLSADQENDADILGVVAASAALSLSTVPWNGPLAAVRVGRVEGNWILNPTFQQLEFSTIDLVGQRLGRLDRDGRGRLARGLRGRDARGAQGGAEGHPRASSASRSSSSTRPARRAEDGVDQGRRRRGAAGEGRASWPRRQMAQAINAAGQGRARRRRSRACKEQAARRAARPSSPRRAARSATSSRTSSTA